MSGREEAIDSLVAYFNTPEGYSAFGWHGDKQGWSPERTAVEGLRDCVRLRSQIAALTTPPAPEEPGKGEDGWLPIESAPKDGTRIIVADHDNRTGEDFGWRVFSARWVEDILPGENGWLHGGCIENPSHWWTGALPPPPRPEGER